MAKEWLATKYKWHPRFALFAIHGEQFHDQMRWWGDSAPITWFARTRDGLTAVDDPSFTSPLATPWQAIRRQLELLAAGSVSQLQDCLAPEIRSQVNTDLVNSFRDRAGRANVESLIDRARMVEVNGNPAWEVLDCRRRVVTTLILRDRCWLASTIWFDALNSLQDGVSVELSHVVADICVDCGRHRTE